MCRNLPSAAFFLAAGVLLVPTTPAYAEQPARIKEMSFTTQSVFNQVISVTSTDNKKWDSIKPGSIKFGAHMMIDTRHYALPIFVKGWVRHAGIVLGSCGGAACLGKPALWAAKPLSKDYEHQTTVTFPTSKIPVSTTGIATVPIGDHIIDRCNAKVTMNGGEAHSFTQWIPVTFVADTTEAVSLLDTGPLVSGAPSVWAIEVDHARSANFSVKVQCEPFTREMAEDVPDDPDFAATDAKVFLSTFSDATTNPAPGVECEKGRVLARIITTKTGPVKFDLWTKVGSEPMQKQFVEAWSSQHGSEYRAEYIKWVSVSKSTSLKAMVQDRTNPFGNTSGWKTIPLHCSAPGGGGWATQPNPNNGDGPKPTAEKPNKQPQIVVTPTPQSRPQISVRPRLTRPAKQPVTITTPLAQSVLCRWCGERPVVFLPSHAQADTGSKEYISLRQDCTADAEDTIEACRTAPSQARCAASATAGDSESHCTAHLISQSRTEKSCAKAGRTKTGCTCPAESGIPSALSIDLAILTTVEIDPPCAFPILGAQERGLAIFRGGQK